jgi:hypothetical protein
MVSLTRPEPNGYLMSGFYYVDAEDGQTINCQLTGVSCEWIKPEDRQCMRENGFCAADCRRCNIPLVFAILKAPTLGRE